MASRIRSLLWAGPKAVEVAGLQRLLQKCAAERRIIEGKCCHGASIHAQLQDDTLTSNILINMYSKCGLIREARQVFNSMPARSIVSWNSMIGGLIDLGEEEEALRVFSCLHREGTPLSEYTLSSVLCVCASLAAVAQSKQLHSLALKIDMAGNVFVGTALLDVYAKCGMIEKAMLVFDGMPDRSSVTWSSMIAGLVHNHRHEEALRVFQMAQKAGTEYTPFTFSAALSACSSLAASTEAVQLHPILVKTGLELNLFVATSLIDVYARCGRIKEAHAVFALAGERSVAVWNVMITGFSKHACAREALMLFEKMRQSGARPNEVTYVAALSAMARAGSVDEGRRLFSALLEDEAVRPNELHYSCMIDALGRAGRLREALGLLRTMPFSPLPPSAGRLFEMEPGNAANHVLLSNLLAAGRRWDDVARTRKLLKDSGAKKAPGMSWIEIQNQIHAFVAGHRSHPSITEIHAKLADLEAEMRRSAAYDAESHHDLHDVDDDEKDELLRHHSEKLALALGLLRLPPGPPVVIHKNLRVCGHCHSFMKLASAITRREIVLRDTNRFHHFSRGHCSCGDFW
ncbi:unnamed protein product [Spirodela intermedia]|uniref:DYW domain-containing protein n=1 Tax=Spirodela intermedia TaxID=51605 RepID=A0A7I8JIG6_SPIIN|nr:unnamed protein product [Spirodela intermedia]CAA6669721.1 unnamed protein product [Spirodela intermedia]